MKIKFREKNLLFLASILVLAALFFLNFSIQNFVKKGQSTDSAQTKSKQITFSSKYLTLQYPRTFVANEVNPSTEDVVEVTNFHQKSCSTVGDIIKPRCLRRAEINIAVQKQTMNIEDFNTNFYDGWKDGVTLFDDCISFKSTSQKTTFLGKEAIRNYFSFTGNDIKAHDCTNFTNWDLDKTYQVSSFVFANHDYIYTVRYSANQEDLLKTVKSIVEGMQIK